MRAVQVVARGDPVKLREIPEPVPAKDEVRIKVLCSSVNFADLLLANGTYQEKPDLPFTLGMEVCGEIDQIGQDVSGFHIGDRVAAYVGYGAMADFCCIPQSNCALVPPEMPSEAAAGFLIAYGTSHVALVRRARLQPNETLLVLGAGGGVGLAAVEIGRLIGAKVIAAARGKEKLEAAIKAGATHIIDTGKDDLRESVLQLGGADVIYDPVGGDLFKAAMRAANREARIIPIGFASGEVPQIPANILLVKNLTVIGVYWGGYNAFNPGVLTDSIRTLMQWYASGQLMPTIGQTVNLEEAGKALDLVRNREAVGKIVIRVSD